MRLLPPLLGLRADGIVDQLVPVEDPQQVSLCHFFREDADHAIIWAQERGRAGIYEAGIGNSGDAVLWRSPRADLPGRNAVLGEVEPGKGRHDQQQKRHACANGTILGTKPGTNECLAGRLNDISFSI